MCEPPLKHTIAINILFGSVIRPDSVTNRNRIRFKTVYFWLCITIASYLHLGGACPPHWVFQKKFLAETAGGWVVGSPTCWLWEPWVWDFSALGDLTSSVSRRVVKLTVSHYYSAPLPLQKRGHARLWGRNPKPCRVHDSKHWEWVGRWWAWHAQWLWFLELERRAIFQQLGKYFPTPIMKSFVLQVQGDLLMRNQVAQGDLRVLTPTTLGDLVSHQKVSLHL